jgi:hypothetical protein
VWLGLRRLRRPCGESALFALATVELRRAYITEFLSISSRKLMM